MIEGLNFGEKPKPGYSRHDVDVDVAELYASEKCKHCYGRGYHVYQRGLHSVTIRKDQPILQYLEYCTCTRKNARKYG